MARTTTPTHTATPKAARAIPSITRMADGRVILTDLPFMIDGLGRDGAAGRAGQLMNAKGLGWTFEKFADGVKGWVSAAPGAAGEAVEALAAYGVAVVDLSGTGAAPVAPGKPATVKAMRKPAPVKATSQGGNLAAKIAEALTADGVAPEIIAAAIAAATAKADEIAKSATATVSAAPVKATRKATVKAAPVKATYKASAKAAPVAAPTGVVVTGDGTRMITLATRKPTKAEGTAMRQAFRRAGFVGVSVAREGNALVAYRVDGAAVSADVDAVMIATVADFPQ